ncbi:MAG: [FeFe] hydrogenase H-cluster radical SAM maturase HydG [Planctomycetota bacterium]
MKTRTMTKRPFLDDSFIDEAEINNILSGASNPDRTRVLEIIEKARDLKGLSMEEAAVLLQADDAELDEALFATARYVKEHIYGKRLVLFAPLYISNYCVNNCLYCAFRRDNRQLNRRALSAKAIREETEILLQEGHKRLLVVFGEHPEKSAIDYIGEAIETVYAARDGESCIRRINVNTAPMTVDEFKILKGYGIGTFQSFQETYHRETYGIMHPSGPKSDYNWRITAMDRAFEGGIDDMGIGILFGLYDIKWEVLALLAHCIHLEDKFGVGPHTISVPRLEPALNAPAANTPPYAVDDRTFKRVVAILRLTVPYTGMILTTRETAQIRRDVFNLGVSQISAGSRTYPGAYKEHKEHRPKVEQFTIHDTRSLDEVIAELCEDGYMPSFCTACYRLGRTGHDFMSLAIPGEIQKFCLPNALLTFQEYLVDYASPRTKELGEIAIGRQFQNVDKKLQAKTEKRLVRIENGEHDLYF